MKPNLLNDLYKKYQVELNKSKIRKGRHYAYKVRFKKSWSEVKYLLKRKIVYKPKEIRKEVKKIRKGR